MLRRTFAAAAMLSFSATAFSAPLALPVLPVLLGGNGGNANALALPVLQLPALPGLQLPLIGSLTNLGSLEGLSKLPLLQGLGDLGELPSGGALLPPLPATPEPLVHLVASLTYNLDLTGLPVGETVVLLDGLLTPVIKPLNALIPLPVVGAIFR